MEDENYESPMPATAAIFRAFDASRATGNQNDAHNDLQRHLSENVDYKKIVEEAKKVAAKRRSSAVISQIMIGVFVVAFSMLSAILLGVSAGLIEYVGAETKDAIRVRYDILGVLPLSIAILSACVWLLVVFRGGWFLYNPSKATSGVRGDTRQWYDATTDALSDTYASVASGLAKCLKINLVTKVQATNLFTIGLLFMSVSLLCLGSILFDYVAVDGFRDVVETALIDNFQNFQLALLNLSSGGRGEEIIRNNEIQLITIPGAFCWIAFIFMPVAAIWLSYLLIGNAFEMRWSLLTSPDTVRRFMYMFVYRRNSDKNLLDDYAWKLAHHFYLRHSLPEAPEDFVGMNGELFFYGDDVSKEVEDFAGMKS